MVVIKSENRCCLFTIDCIDHTFSIKHSIHSMLTMHTIILQSAVYILGMFMEERKIAL